MANFPALKPNTRTYMPGRRPSTPIPTTNGDEISVRHSNGATSYILRLGFRALTPAEHFAVLGHYNLHERFIPFDLSAETLEGSNLTFPTNYQWIYLASPSVEVLPSQTNITVELELLPPYSI